MAARAYQRGYYAVREEGRQEGWKESWKEGWKEGWKKGWREGARQTKVDLMVDMLLPVAGADFEEELRMLLDAKQLLSRLDVNTMVDLRIRHDADPAALRQAMRNLLDNPGDLG